MLSRTFQDFTWRSRHHLPAKHGSAAHPHWHGYRARFWFTGEIDQDWLTERLEAVFGRLRGCALNTFVQPTSTDEELSAWLYREAQQIGNCVRVVVETDGYRGAEFEP